MQVSQYLGIPAVVVIFVYIIAKTFQGKKRKRSAKPGTVVLHQFAPTELCVSASPPCLKLETFLRMTKIPYENEYGLKFSKKGKIPWIEFNGQEIADSNFCIQFLKKEFKVDIDSHLNANEKAIARTVRTMLEENTYWTLVYYRFFTPSFAERAREILFGHLIMPIKYLVYYMIKRKVKKDLWSHGIGRHSEQEVYGIAERDLLAVSEILGQKKFLFGEKPCLADVAVFAFVCGATLECPQSPFAELTKSKAQNLQKHAQRMKELYFPDWDDIISKKPKSS
ncbi:failed axon connections homolog [Stylophora pistillata]|uniref:Failed axon connections-like n=1 Tax=Stylophora pistillata TaxID=50429 RepID=A0A2B4S1P7_STYPI|nr:failed axon connections homolog [Stylophora pistillata]PFX22720.1 Failed axon connections-like [Stylophora pistillata]